MNSKVLERFREYIHASRLTRLNWALPHLIRFDRSRMVRLKKSKRLTIVHSSQSATACFAQEFFVHKTTGNVIAANISV